MTARPAAACITVGAERSWVDGTEYRSPLASGRTDIANLVERAAVAGGKNPGVTLVVLADALPALDLPPRPDAVADDVLGMVRALGWRVGKARDEWVSCFWTGRPAVHLHVPSWASGKHRHSGPHGPLVDPADPAGTSARVARYVALTGGPYVVNPGVSFPHALRERDWRATPYWKPETLPRRCRGPIADGERETSWGVASPPGLYVHGYDAVAAYLNAAQAVDVSPGDLERRRGKGSWDPKRAGWWLIEPPVWQHPQMPSPVHDLPRDSAGRCWVTTPTLALLGELAEAGECASPVLHDSWTGESKRVLRPWAERIRDAMASLAGPAPCEVAAAAPGARVGVPPEYPNDAAVWQALKDTYRQGIGMLAYGPSQVYRPDWQQAVVAQARVGLWKKLWTIGKAEGRWPVAIHKVDLIEFASADQDPITAAPRGLKLGEALGCHRPAEGWHPKAPARVAVPA